MPMVEIMVHLCVCSSVWPSTPRLQDNSIMFCLCIAREQADAHRLGSLSKGLRYTTVSFLSHFGIVIAYRKWKKNHSFSVFMSCIYIFSISYCLATTKNMTKATRKKYEKMRQQTNTHRQFHCYAETNLSRNNIEKMRMQTVCATVTAQTQSQQRIISDFPVVLWETNTQKTELIENNDKKRIQRKRNTFKNK